MGRAIACVVLPHLGGSGPDISPGPMQRDLVPSEVKKLWELGGRDQADKLLRFDPKHELTITVSGAAVDKTSLTTSLNEPFPHIQWLDNASATDGYLLAGQHRCAVMKMILQPTLDEFGKVEAKLEKDPDNQTLKDQYQQLLLILQTKGIWLVAFYDHGMCTVVQSSACCWRNLLFLLQIV